MFALENFIITTLMLSSLSISIMGSTTSEEINVCIPRLENGCYCECDHGDELEVETLNCNFWESPQIGLWSAMSKLKNVNYFEVRQRHDRTVKEMPPCLLFKALRKLTHFTMKYSQIQKISSYAFGNSSSLSDVILKDNMIDELESSSFSNMKNVSKINLSDNLLTEINRHVFANLPKLQGLYLDRNRIEVVHDRAFQDLESLEELSMQRNNLTVIAREVFSGLKKMIHLDLQNNAIEYLGDHVFADMPLLHELDLHDNNIRSISSTAFSNLNLLGRLNLKGNKIVSLQALTFNPIGMMYSLDLRANELETLSERLVQPIYDNFKNGSFQLQISGNRFTCNCEILWMQKLHKETESKYVKTELENLDCNMFHTTEQKHQRHLYTANITLEKSPEETTTFSFDGIKRVIKLSPSDFKCQQQQTDLASVPQSDGNVRSSNESKEGSPVVSENQKDIQQSHHQSHVDKADDVHSGVTIGHDLTFTSLICVILLLVRGNLR